MASPTAAQLIQMDTVVNRALSCAQTAQADSDLAEASSIPSWVPFFGGTASDVSKNIANNAANAWNLYATLVATRVEIKAGLRSEDSIASFCALATDDSLWSNVANTTAAIRNTPAAAAAEVAAGTAASAKTAIAAVEEAAGEAGSTIASMAGALAGGAVTVAKNAKYLGLMAVIVIGAVVWVFYVPNFLKPKRGGGR
jgi:hypothetical protein